MTATARKITIVETRILEIMKESVEAYRRAKTDAERDQILTKRNRMGKAHKSLFGTTAGEISRAIARGLIIR